MSHAFCSHALICFSLLGTSPLLAQSSDCPKRPFVVQVVDRKGVPVPDLVISDFEASYNGQPVPLKSVRHRTLNNRIVLLVDKSSSMGLSQGNFNGIPSTPSEAMVVQEFLSSLSSRIPVALMFFGEKVESKTGFAESREALLQMASQEFRHSKQWKGDTALWDAVFEATLLLDKPQVGDSIVVITDGGDNHSKHRQAEVTAILLAQRIRLFAFVPLAREQAPEEASGAEELTHMARETGGREIEQENLDLNRQPNQSQVTRAASEIFWRLLTGYLVELALPATWTTTKKWSLKIRNDVKARKNIARVEYPARLMPCLIPAGTGAQ